MKKMLLAASFAVATMTAAAPVSAAVVFTFTPGPASSPSSGFTVIDTFDNLSGVAAYSNAQIKTPPADGDGAPPANSSPSGTPYLSVLGGGFATINFSAPVYTFQFDWGSVDSYNQLTIYSSSGSPVVVPGLSFPNAADGNQVSPGTNGLFTVTGTAGEVFTGFKLESSSNSFEIDNLATGPVPEPGTWALMIMGFGAMGAMLRRRRQTVQFA